MVSHVFNNQRLCIFFWRIVGENKDLRIPLRTLDALHLMIAKEIQADVLATADKMMAVGGKAMGFSVVRFD